MRTGCLDGQMPLLRWHRVCWGCRSTAAWLGQWRTVVRLQGAVIDMRAVLIGWRWNGMRPIDWRSEAL